ncbi:hypothetical protein M885DRAFT_504980 [Pelagophyceae sp. CCMP2097]|nr:hypothetical protein M885DRAFT_504980 [Pelagophyceae sp. CCMP2097]
MGAPLLWLLALYSARISAFKAVDVTFVNEQGDTELFWEFDGPDGSGRHSVGVIAQGESLAQETRPGHTFSYMGGDGYKRYAHIEANTKTVALAPRGLDAIDVVFRNELDVGLDLFWHAGNDAGDATGDEVKVGTLDALGGESLQHTNVGHLFSWRQRGSSTPAPADLQLREIGPADTFIVTAPKGHFFRVECSIATAAAERGAPVERANHTIHVFPEWSPRGAARLLELVRSGFDGSAFFRFIANSHVQFGIPESFESRDFWKDAEFADDAPRPDLKFVPGTIAFANDGPHTRATEMFAVIGDAQKFGVHLWETPVAQLLDAGKFARAVAHAYDPQPEASRIYSWGDSHLRQSFPLLARIAQCTVVFREDEACAAPLEPEPPAPRSKNPLERFFPKRKRGDAPWKPAWSFARFGRGNKAE